MKSIWRHIGVTRKGRNGKWQAVVRKKNKTIYRSFTKKSDASKWATFTEAHIETGTYKRIKEAEKIADIRICELLNIYYEKHLRLKSSIYKKDN